MYRELVIRAYSKEAIERIDLIRNSGINMTDLILSLIMTADLEKIRDEQRKQKELVCA
jgi:hypothetical protein